MLYDVIIIGAGPGGYECALELNKENKKVCLIERDSLGGTCTNRGCIPTKSLLASSKIIDSINSSSKHGITVENYSIDFQKLMTRKTRIVNTLKKGIEISLKKTTIDLKQGEAKLISSTQVKVNDETLEASNIIIATGSEPVKFFDGENVMTSDDILDITEIPKKLVIIGGGVIGVEFANIFSSFGSSVTVIEAEDRLLPHADLEISQEISTSLKRKGIKILLGVKADYSNNELKINDSSIEYDKILIGVGRNPVLPEGLDAVGIEHDRSIKVNDNLQTNIDNIYSIGDCSNNLQLAHVASHEARIVAKTILGSPSKPNYDLVPFCLYTNPEIAFIGKRQQDLDDINNYKITKSNYSANAKSKCSDKPFGFIKIISEKESGIIVGVHIIGERATDMIIYGEELIKTKTKIQDLDSNIFPHPTFSEIFIGT